MLACKENTNADRKCKYLIFNKRTIPYFKGRWQPCVKDEVVKKKIVKCKIKTMTLCGNQSHVMILNVDFH